MKTANFSRRIAQLPRFVKQLTMLGVDVGMLLLGVYLAYVLRYGFLFLPNTKQILLMLAAPLVAVPVFIRYGLYRAVIRYLPEKAIWSIFQATAVASLLWVALVFLTEMTGGTGVPRSVPLIYWLVITILVSISRFGAKWILHESSTPVKREVALIIGTGEAAQQLAAALRVHRDTFVAGFIDRDPSLQGMDIAGTRVYAPTAITDLVDNYGVCQVVISDPSMSEDERKTYVSILGRLKIRTSILPPIADLSRGKYLVGALRKIEIDDLLGRSPVPPDEAMLQSMIEGRAIMVTGAGGSIGSELCRTIVNWKPRKLVLFEVSEFALYQQERKLKAASRCEIIPVLGSVTQQELVENVIASHGIDTIYHCAAYKHVPLVEANPLEGIRNNIMGTKAVADAALKTGVERFILISSDKAVRPTNVMGATKRWAEFVIRHYGDLAQQKGAAQSFSSVRFGNVLGSNGSVVPLFREQIAAGGPVTLTDEDMTRYFMSIREAAELIIQSGAVIKSGETALLEMGRPVKIRDLAENMILMAGLTVRDIKNPDGDIAIRVTGIREGEKLYEELFYDPDKAQRTRHPKILCAEKRGTKADEIPQRLPQMQRFLDSNDSAGARSLLFDYISQ
ncbi:nucleoside-diphosphate sugar epimerase/dehydratase [Pseudochrobactrum sp. sp1633]|uniref:nucleoside-diphosphate sugar epimerase/dehydratase n=1 Tax=Pseudochrobactrum sp. sp1633 TaxID=3036706 RepID=UPI0025A5F96A|nr:nucleoside-diphosphate sugar epimerase/dehydratase [Pseudochrobactrum sp. sp1633]MDM8345231.1 nucleoside-diphosphate sugar epimerase/dehydratase [Pseudochrobactrum sp. sp1633]HWD12918.1 nucleoside-diphosphate sugar epimerase/dehydratase [Pseudochrobactrum sp.]